MKISIKIGKPKVRISVKAPSVGVSTGTPIIRDYIEIPAYEGAYDVVPSEEGTVLNTQQLRMTDNVRVAPIPSNYGLIARYGDRLIIT